MTRRTRPAALLGVVLAAGLLVGLGGAPAPAADTQSISGATLTWGVSGYAQKGVFGPWRFLDPTGGATVLIGTTSGGSQDEYVATPGDTSMPASTPQKTPNAVKFVGGTGTADPDTGAMTLAWSGTYAVNAYPAAYGAPQEYYVDPRLTVASDGSGELTMQVVIGAGQDMEGNPTPAQDLGRLAVATFSPAADDVEGDTFRYTPDYQGVEVDGLSQDRSCEGTWGAWPAAFVTAMPDSVQPHFYSTGCGGLQDAKPPLPVDVDLGLSGQSSSSLAIAAPAGTAGQQGSATVTVTGASAGAVSLRLGGTEVGRGTLSDGAATFTFGPLSAGSRQLTAVYYGSKDVEPAVGTAALKVAKAKSTTSLAITKKPTTTKAGAARIVVKGAVAATGKVTIRLRKGSTTVKTFRPALKAGKAAVTLPKQKKGTYSLIAAYPGNANLAPSHRSVKVVVR